MLLCYFVTDGNLKICYVNSNAIYSVSTRYLPENSQLKIGNYIRVDTDFILKDNLDNYFLKQKYAIEDGYKNK